jgi:hypothetical protein
LFVPSDDLEIFLLSCSAPQLGIIGLDSRETLEEKSERVISEISDFPLRNKNTCFNHIGLAEKGQGF